MQQFTVSKAESGQQLIKYLKHLMPKAQNGFLYKMLRKKNITLNGKKSDGSATILQDDVIRLFLSDDTIHMLMAGNAADKPHEKVNGTEDKAAGEDRITKIGGTDKSRRKNDGNENGNENYDPDKIKASMIYEDEDLIIFNKPAGMLSQKAKAEDISANEVLIGYIKRNGYSELSFKPSVLNRLDRNTSGILLFGRSYRASRHISKLLKDRTLEKHYKAVVLGKLDEKLILKGRLIKDAKTNTVRILPEKDDNSPDHIETVITPVSGNEYLTVADVHLVTGKPHQIRAHLSSIGHPIAGDPKYGDRKRENRIMDSLGIPQDKRPMRQLLHAERIIFPKMPSEMAPLSGRTFTAQIPEDMMRILKYLE